MIDGVTLTDTITRLFKAGKVADVAVVAGAVNDEGANIAPRNVTISPAASQIWNLTESQIEEAITYYPVNETFGSSSPDNFFLSDFKAYIQSLNSFGEAGITGSERLIGRYMSEAFGPEKVWTFRFNAPSKSFRSLLIDLASDASWLTSFSCRNQLQRPPISIGIRRPLSRQFIPPKRNCYHDRLRESDCLRVARIHRIIHSYWRPKQGKTSCIPCLAPLRILGQLCDLSYPPSLSIRIPMEHRFGQLDRHASGGFAKSAKLA